MSDTLELLNKIQAGQRIDDDYNKTLARRQQDENLGWLNQRGTELGLIPPPQAEQPQTPGAQQAQPAGDGMAMRVAKDIGKGVVMEAPQWTLGAGMKAWDGVMGLVDQAADWLNNNVADLSYGGYDSKDPKAQPLTFGDSRLTKTDTVTGSLLQGLMQFATGWSALSKAGWVAGNAKTAVGQAAQFMAKGAAVDFSAFDGQEGNLANLINELAPPLKGPITEFLATDQETPELEGRLKNALVGAVPNAAIDGVVLGLRAWKAARRAKALTGSDTYQEAADKLLKGQGDPTAVPEGGTRLREIMGDPEGDLVQFGKPIDTGLADNVTAKNMAGVADQPAPTQGRASVADDLPDFVKEKKVVEIPGGGQVEGIRVFHGTPHDFDQFDMSKTGTGEGAQAYGRGLYFAENEKIAYWYRDKLTDGGGYALTSADGRTQVLQPGTPEAHAAYAVNMSGGDFDKAIQQYTGDGPLTPIIRKWQADGAQVGSKVDTGNVYEVRVNATPDDFLDWDRPIGQQSEKVRAAAARLGLSEHITGQQFLSSVSEDQLKNAGIAGVRYLDQGSRAAGEGTSNFVVFDDKLLTIVGKNGQRVTAGTPPPLPDAKNMAGVADGKPAPDGAPAGATGETPARPVSHPEAPGEVYINWARMDTQDSVKEAMQRLANENWQGIRAKQRRADGPRTFDEIRKDAEAEEAWNLVLGERKKNAAYILSDSETLALRNLKVAAMEKLQEVSQLAAQGGREEKLAALQMMETYRQILLTAKGVSAEQSRALGQWRIAAKATREATREIDRLILQAGGQDSIDAIVRNIAAVGQMPGGQIAIDTMMAKADKWMGKTSDFIHQWWMSAILSGPHTNMVNVLSNQLVLVQSVVERAVAARIGELFTPEKAVEIGEAAAMWHGIRNSTLDAFRNTGKAWWNDQTGYWKGTPGGPENIKLEAGFQPVRGQEILGDNLFGKGLDMLSSGLRAISGRAMAAGDEGFKTLSHRAELYAQAFRQAKEEIRLNKIPEDDLTKRIVELITEPTEEMRMKATDFAEYNTFTQDPGHLTRLLMQIRNNVPGGRYVVPFIPTVANITKHALERTPFAPMMAKVRADIKAGGARRDLALARMGLGTMATMTMLDLALNGDVTGGGPDGKAGAAEKSVLRNAGWQPYSVRVVSAIDKDGKPVYRYFAYNRLDPIGMMMGIGADLGEYIANKGGGVDMQEEEIFAQVVLSMANVMMDKTYLSSFSRFVDAVKDPKVYGERFFTGLAAGFVPNALNTGRRIMDPHLKHTTDAVTALKAKTPGLSAEVPNRLDMFGRPIQFTSGLGGAYDATVPIYSSSTEKAEPIHREFVALNYFPPERIPISLKGTRDDTPADVSLRNRPLIVNQLKTLSGATSAQALLETNEEDMRSKGGAYRAYAKTLMEMGNRSMLQALNDLVTGKLDFYSDEYKAESTEGKVEMIQKIMRAYRGAARVQVLREHPELQELRDQRPTRQERRGLSPF